MMQNRFFRFLFDPKFQKLAIPREKCYHISIQELDRYLEASLISDLLRLFSPISQYAKIWTTYVFLIDIKFKKNK